MPDVDLRPLSLGELLDRTFSLYRRHFWLFVVIMAVPQLLVFTASLAVVVFPGSHSRTTSQGPPVASAPSAGVTEVAFLPGFAILAIVFLAAYVLAQAATVFAVSEIYLGRPASIRRAYARVRGQVWRLLLVFLMIGLAAFAGFVLLIVPGVLVMLATALAVPALVLEGGTARAAIRRSWDLTRGNRGRIFMIWLLFFILTWVAAAVFAYPFLFAQMLLLKQGQQSTVLAILGQMGGFVAKVLVGPLATIAFSLVYYDVRIRREAFDLQVMMAGLGPSATPGGSAPAV